VIQQDPGPAFPTGPPPPGTFPGPTTPTEIHHLALLLPSRDSGTSMSPARPNTSNTHSVSSTNKQRSLKPRKRSQSATLKLPHCSLHSKPKGEAFEACSAPLPPKQRLEGTLYITEGRSRRKTGRESLRISKESTRVIMQRGGNEAAPGDDGAAVPGVCGDMV